MELKYTVKIKGKHRPPVFKDGLGRGVVHTRVVEFKGTTEADLETPVFQKQIYEYAHELLNEYFEVKVELTEPNNIKKLRWELKK